MQCLQIDLNRIKANISDWQGKSKNLCREFKLVFLHQERRQIEGIENLRKIIFL
jgi:hypothetical protein